MESSQETPRLTLSRAYEVLSQPERRRQYDFCGAAGSPPPRRAADPSHTFFGTSPDSQPFSFHWESSHDSARRAQAQRGHGNRRAFGLDPFELFNQMFASELSGLHSGRGVFDEHPFFATHQRMMPNSMMGGFGAMDDMFGSRHTDMLGSGSVPPSHRGMADPFGGGFGSMMDGMSSSMMGGGAGGSFASESRQTRTVNGRTETVIRKVDSQGNETVHTVGPEGERVEVNGVEDRQHPLLQQGGGAAGALPFAPRPGWS